MLLSDNWAEEKGVQGHRPETPAPRGVGSQYKVIHPSACNKCTSQPEIRGNLSQKKEGMAEREGKGGE